LIAPRIEQQADSDGKTLHFNATLIVLVTGDTKIHKVVEKCLPQKCQQEK